MSEDRIEKEKRDMMLPAAVGTLLSNLVIVILGFMTIPLSE